MKSSTAQVDWSRARMDPIDWYIALYVVMRPSSHSVYDGDPLCPQGPLRTTRYACLALKQPVCPIPCRLCLFILSPLSLSLLSLSARLVTRPRFVSFSLIPRRSSIRCVWLVEPTNPRLWETECLSCESSARVSENEETCYARAAAANVYANVDWYIFL